MIGHVEDLHALLPVIFRLPDHRDISLEFVIDTEFTDERTLPREAVAALGLPYEYDLVVNLANDTDVVVPVHSATIIWENALRMVRVFATGRRPLLGTALLAGNELITHFREGGLVTVEQL